LETVAQTPVSDSLHSVILYKEGAHAHVLSEAPGWIIDGHAGASQGLPAVLYRQDESWAQGVAVMYAHTRPKAEDETLLDIIETGIADFESRSPTLEVTVDQPITTADGKTAKVRIFRGDEF